MGVSTLEEGGHTIEVTQASVEIDGGNRVEVLVCSLHGGGEDVAVVKPDGVGEGSFLEGHGCGGYYICLKLG